MINLWLAMNSSTESAPRIRHVLYEYDGPKMVLAMDGQGRQVLGIAVDENDDGTIRWFFAAAPPAQVLNLLNSGNGLRGFFDHSVIEAHDIQSPWRSIRSGSLAPGDVSNEVLPDVDARLPAFVDSFRALLIEDQQRLDRERDRLARTKLFFDGAPVLGSRGIRAAFAAEALASYQNLVSLTHANWRQDKLPSRGRIPQRADSTLMITDMLRGSVGFELVEESDEARVERTDLADVVVHVGLLLDAAATNDSTYAEAVAEWDPRVVNAMHDFFLKLKNAEASMRLEVNDREYVFNTSRIVEGSARTASAPRETFTPIRGTLIGLLPIDRRFELQTEDNLLKGKLARNVDADEIKVFFAKECVATVRIIEIERLGQTTQTFTLVGIAKPE